MGKHMIVACIILSSLSINVIGNDVQTYLHKLKTMQRTLKTNRFERQFLEKRYAEEEIKKDKTMHAINDAEEQNEFQRQIYIDNIVSTSNVEKRHMKKADTIGAKFNKREHFNSNDISVGDTTYSSCHVKDWCEDESTVSDPCSTTISRERWCARNAKNSSYLDTPVSNVYIYQTAMYACYSEQKCEYEVTKVQEIHMDKDGLDDIGYSFLVGDDGYAYEAGGWDRVGAQTRGGISNSISIAVMGTYDEDLPTEDALKAINRLIACGIYTDKVMPDYKLYGYRDPVSKFESTGHKLYDLIQTWSHFSTPPP